MKSLASRNSILKETQDAVLSFTPPPKSKPNTPRSKPTKENAPPQTAIDPNSSNIKSPLPPRPPLKRKLSASESGSSDDCPVASNFSDSGVKVVVRVRPPRSDEEDEGNVIQKITEDSLTISGQTFTFDSVADVQSKQIDIFQHVGAPLVENCLSGFNSSVFAYGQTGSGKTYTIWGPCNAHSDDDQQGLAPRVFQRLFERIEEEQVKHADKQLIYMCHCSFLEIYNEQITDLLDPTQKNLQIREDVKTGVYVENLREECVSSPDHVSQLLMKGLSNRKTSATYLNAESSRSHSVFTCVVESRIKNVTDGVMQIRTSKINFVDLAGSERQKQTGAVGERLKEAGNINRSLSQLGNLINILAEVSHGKQRHIPYRDSKLTFLLQESLGGNAKLAMICAVSPFQSCKSETLSTLRFAQRAKSIKNRAIVNEELQDDVNVLREVIRKLKDELQRMKSNNNMPNETGAYATGWSARRSLNLLRFSLNRPAVLPHVNNDSDEEMEIMDNSKIVPSITEETHAGSPEPDHEDADVNMSDEASYAVRIGDDSGCGMTSQHFEENSDTMREDNNCCGDATTANFEVLAANMSPILTSPDPSISPRSSTGKRLRTSLTITPSECVPGQNISLLNPSMRKAFMSLPDAKSCFTSNDHLEDTLHRGLEIIHSQTRRSAFSLTSTAAAIKAIIPVVKVDVGVQASFSDHDSLEMDEYGSLCHNCKHEKSQNDLKDEHGDDYESMQLALLDESSKTQVPKEVEKVLAGSIRREVALEELCSKQNSEIMHLNRLVQQYKHERECNEIIRQIRDDKIARLESLSDGILSTEDFMEEEMLHLAHEHKILVEKYENHPELMRTKIELKRALDEIEKYQNFFNLGERDVLLEEIQDLRNQLQIYLDSSSRTCNREAPPPLPQITSSCEQVDDIPGTTSSADNIPQQDRIQWTEMESKWKSLVDELRAELEVSRSITQKQMDELEMEKKCSEELKEAISMAMKGHARMLEQFADLEEKHILLLARHRKLQDGVDDVKKATSKAGVRGAASKLINALAAEISSLKVEREKERRYLRDENKGLQEQLRDTAEAVQAASELLVRLKETEEALAAEQKRVRVAEQETEDAYRELDKLNKLLAAHHAHEQVFGGEDESKGAGDWQEEFAPSYGVEEEPPMWFSGYDRCNI